MVRRHRNPRTRPKISVHLCINEIPKCITEYVQVLVHTWQTCLCRIIYVCCVCCVAEDDTIYTIKRIHFSLTFLLSAYHETDTRNKRIVRIRVPDNKRIRRKHNTSGSSMEECTCKCFNVITTFKWRRRKAKAHAHNGQIIDLFIVLYTVFNICRGELTEMRYFD